MQATNVLARIAEFYTAINTLQQIGNTVAREHTSLHLVDFSIFFAMLPEGDILVPELYLRTMCFEDSYP